MPGSQNFTESSKVKLTPVFVRVKLAELELLSLTVTDVVSASHSTLPGLVAVIDKSASTVTVPV